MEKQKSRILAIASAALLVLTSQALSAAKYSVIHAFDGSNGSSPGTGLVFDNVGDLFGTARLGGTGRGCSNGCGTAFKIAGDGTATVVHNFAYRQGGAYPNGGMVEDKSGNFYGTASTDRDKSDCKPDVVCSIIYKISSAGVYSILHYFLTESEGNWPLSTLIADKSGNLYGTASLGGGKGCGSNGCGTVFKLAEDGTLKVFYIFTGGNDGANPEGNLTLDKNGNLYGTTRAGGGTGCSALGCGTVFRINSDGTEIILHSFGGGDDGATPRDGLVLAKDGNFYGTTEAGGGNACNGYGCGTIFKITPDGAENVAYVFRGGSDGAYPVAGLAADKKGNLFGTTGSGGSGCDGGCGIIFKLAVTGRKTELYSFTGGTDGSYPDGTLIFGRDGFLYGAAGDGGLGYGTIFKISP